MEKPYIVLYEIDFNEFRGTRHSTPYGIAQDLAGMKRLDINAMANTGRNRTFLYDYKEWTKEQIAEMKKEGKLIWDFTEEKKE